MNKTNPSPHRSCDQLGVCQGLSAEQCPNCTSWECEVAVPAPVHRVVVPCATYPFAPGVIEGPKQHTAYAAQGAWRPLSLAEACKLLGFIVVLGAVAGYVVERYL